MTGPLLSIVALAKTCPFGVRVSIPLTHESPVWPFPYAYDLDAFFLPEPA